ncbi:CobW family GTP-binding protein [Acetonema longum]|uniref:Cobalamin synthesis protein P47K n=1 Tax=Acetonema longum DSM 6540 TaxID=1009370 RepID=F7NM38_9FIRM|nr:GTP-binding protein [Acetonema longum]EGO62893.1 cobalamin synthesis protein P47K [Acetonema longum DSM 6540]
MEQRIPLDIVSGFLGAGKTTLILKMLKERKGDEKIFILENEYGKAGIDGILLSGNNAEIKEIYSGCICCSLKGEFTQVLKQVISNIKPGRIMIEPTGIGKLSEVLKIVQQPCFRETIVIDYVITVVDVHEVYNYLRNFGEFYKDQIYHAKIIVLSKTQGIPTPQIQEIVNLIRGHNSSAKVVTSPWDQLDIQEILQEEKPYEEPNKNETAISPKKLNYTRKQAVSSRTCNHHPGAADILDNVSWKGLRVFSISSINAVLSAISTGQYGQILRAKGIVAGKKDWIHFEYVNGKWQCNTTEPLKLGRAVFIGKNLLSEKLLKLVEGPSNAESC